MWFGYISFGYHRRRDRPEAHLRHFLLAAGVLLPLYGFLARRRRFSSCSGRSSRSSAAGYYSGFGAVVAELYPTSVRATAAGVCYNTGRIASAAAPFVVGSLAKTRGFGVAFSVAGAAFLLAAVDVDLDSGNAQSGTDLGQVGRVL